MKNHNGPILFLTIIISLQTALSAYAETEVGPPDLTELVGKLVRIGTSGRGNFTGVLLTVSKDRIEIESSDGEIIQISRQAITQHQEIIPTKRGKAFYQDSASNRLLVAPTAFAMEPGEFHIADQEIAVVTTSYGIGEHASLWAGISPVGALFSGRLIASIGGSFAVSVGSFAGIEWLGAGGGPVSGLLLPYAIFSGGKSSGNITAGGAAALWFTSDTGSELVGAVGVIGGKLVLTATTALVTENWIVWGKLYSPDILDHRWYGIPVAAISGLVFRIAGDRFTWDIGAILPLLILDESTALRTARIRGIIDDLWIPIPWISVTYRIQ